MSGRFRGELFGLGTNHTKYKNKPYMNSTNTANGLGVSLVRQTSAEAAYGASLTQVHYPTGGMGGHQSVAMAGGFQVYEESSSPDNGPYGSP